jgi:transmembrane sensor
MDQTLFWNLLAKKIAGEASEEELQRLETLTKLNPEWAYQAEHIQYLWNTTSDKEQSEFAFEQHLQKMKEAGVDLKPAVYSNKSDKKPARVKNIFIYSAAAIVLFLIAGFVWLNSNKRNALSAPEKKYSEISSPFGSKTKLVLPDSTVVWLNAGSKLTYNEHFGITNRNTTLIGEAFFDVKKSTVPFTIRANNIQIKVLGTAFNVKAYPEDKTTETSLLRGRVEVTLDKRPGERIVLKPNEKLIVANEKLDVKPEVQKKDPKVVIDELTRINDTTIVETSWVHNELIFQDETLREVAHKMERWYGFTIEIADEEIANERLSGTFTTETIQEALTALQYSTKFHYSIKGKQVTITSN